MVTLLTLGFRAALLYILLIVATRIMGKRQIGQLQAFEFVIAILIAELAALPMESPDEPLMHGIVPILVVSAMYVGFSLFSIKYQPFRKILCGTPSVLVENGKLVEKELYKTRITVHELLEQLRTKDIFKISDVEFAVLETSGQLSVIPKSQHRPLTPKDLGIATDYEGLSLTLVVDGRVDMDALERAGLDVPWLRQELDKFEIKRLKDVLLAVLNTNGNLFVQTKHHVDSRLA